MKRYLLLNCLVLTSTVLFAQIRGDINKSGEKPVIAVPDLRGSGDAQRLMGGFNSTLFSDLQSSGQLKMAPKTFYPLQIPQQPSDFKQPANGNGLWLTDWSSPPTSANYLAFGYTAASNGQILLYGWLDDVRQPNPTSAQVSAKCMSARSTKPAPGKSPRNSPPTYSNNSAPPA